MVCKNILIIEDDEDVRQSMQDALELRGYEPIVAVDGKDGVAKLNSMAQPPCVILLDIMMPIMNGWQFLEYQRSNPKFANIPVIICSAFKESAKTLKSVTFVPKPLELKTLIEAVQVFCKGAS